MACWYNGWRFDERMREKCGLDGMERNSVKTVKRVSMAVLLARVSKAFSSYMGCAEIVA